MIQAANDAGFTYFHGQAKGDRMDGVAVRQIDAAVGAGRAAGAEFIIFGAMTLKPGRQRDHFLRVLERAHRERLAEYDVIYRGDPQGAPVKEYGDMADGVFAEVAARHRMPVRMPRRLFGGLLDENDHAAVILDQIDYLYKLKGWRSAYGYAGWQISQLTQPLSSVRDRDLAAAELELARAARTEVAGTRLELARAQLAQSQAAAAEARNEVEKTRLRAPEAGQVLELKAHTGEFVPTGQAVMVFVPADSVSYVEVQVDETAIARLKKDQEAVVNSPSFPGRTFSGRVKQIAPFIDARRGTFTVKVVLDEKVPEFVSDLSVTVQITTGRLSNERIVPRRYLFQEEGRAFVYVLTEGKIAKRAVTAADLGNGIFMINGEIDEGTLVVAGDKLREGVRASVSRTEG